ncbi:hypothetical protein G7Y89_g2513 [Cudoniella acicularis]|uniref:Uncharacterized protein n=1 Tax=Cudoniella acicularis TaxID=354080 RepID=A0A8H4RT61_9HELO|nr:hypothetical protein G7Y89_g2513 [Cudoniella acicularis]
MADRAEATPFLENRYRDNEGDHDEEQGYIVRNLQANAHFKHGIRILKVSNSFFSLAAFALLITSAVILQVGPFEAKWMATAGIRDLAIGLGVNLLVSIPVLFLELPTIINTAVHLIMSIVILVFSSKLFADGWPNDGFCHRWIYPAPMPGNRWPSPIPTPESEECISARVILRIVMGVGAGTGILIGLILIALTLFQLIAVIRTKFWERQKFLSLNALRSWKPKGFTVQFTLTVLPQGESGAGLDSTKTAAPPKKSTNTVEGRLIET